LDLLACIRQLRRHWILIVAVTLTGILVGAAVSALARPTFTAETQLFVAIQGSGSTTELQEGNTFSQARVQSYLKTVASPMVLQPAIDSLGLSESPETLADRVTASADVNTVLIDIRVVDDSPAQAAAVAQAIAGSLIRAVENLEKPGTGGPSPVNLSVTKPATAPATPSSPNTRMNLFVGLMVGLALALLIAFSRSALDRRITGEADLRRVTQAPLLGGISFDPDAIKKPLLTQAAPQSSRAESFHRLRTNVQFTNIPGRCKIVLMTSSIRGEGKSTTAINLSIALAQAGQSVCLIDADLRRPMVAEYLGLDRKEGLTTALLGAGDVDDLLQPSEVDRLFVLASGQIPPNPSELVGSEEMKRVLDRLASRFDVVIIDAPPLVPFTDAAVLSQHVGGVVVVVGAQELRDEDLESSLSSLRMVGANLVGVVLNRITRTGPAVRSYDYHSSAAVMENEDAENRRSVTTALEPNHGGNLERVAFDSAPRDARARPSGAS
jgi:capsular exopolysaccharide synthesis family protein